MALVSVAKASHFTSKPACTLLKLYTPPQLGVKHCPQEAKGASANDCTEGKCGQEKTVECMQHT